MCLIGCVKIFLGYIFYVLTYIAMTYEILVHSPEFHHYIA